MAFALRRPSPRHRLVLRRIAIALLALYALYAIAANVFLSTPLSQRAFNRSPQHFHIAWTRAYSLYPGHVHASGVRVGGHVRRNRWQVTSPEADTRVRLLPLLLRRLSFAPIDARAVVLVMERDAPHLAPRQGTSPWPPFRLHFDAIRSDSPRSLRLADWTVDELRDAQATFAFDKTLRGGPIAIRPSRLTARSARVSFGKRVLAQDARIDYAMTMAPNTYRQAQGFERVRFVDATLRLGGSAPGLQVARRSGQPLAFATGRGDGRVAVNAAIDDGVLRPGGTLRWSAPLLSDGGQAAARRDRLQVHAVVRESGIAVHASVPRRRDRADFIDARLLVAERRLQRSSVRELLRATSGAIALRWHFDTLAWLNPMITDGGWLRLDGQADVDADLRVHKGRLAAGSRAQIPRAQVQADVFDTVLTGDARAKAVVDARQTRVDIVARRFNLAPRAAPRDTYIEGNDVALVLLASGDVADFRRNLQVQLRFGEARIPDLSAYNRNLPGDSLRLLGGRGTLGADLALDAQGRVRTATLNLRGTDADVRLGASRILGNLTLDTRLRQADGGARRYAIDALALRLDDVRVDQPDAPPWWARLDLDRGTLDWRQPFALRGDARLQMQDASVLLDLYSERSAFPKWIGNLVDAGQVDATARVRVHDDTAAFERIRARNDRVALQAHLRIAGGEPEGALLAKWGVLDIGAEVRGGQRKLRLKGAEAWYRSQPEDVR